VQLDAGTWLMLAGMGVLACSAVCFWLWLWRFLRGNPPWASLMLLALTVNYPAGRPLVGAYPWAAPVDSVVSWSFLLGLVLPVAATPPPIRAGSDSSALGENIVGDALALLGHDHVVIHNLPLAGYGDADHMVVGPAGAFVIETKYLAGRIVCWGDGVWTQVKRDEVHQIADPAARGPACGGRSGSHRRTSRGPQLCRCTRW
jgi:nuclease-like protein